jgi:hypothetical protein
MRCDSIAFPLLASGNNSFDKELAIQIAKESIGQFTGESLKEVYLVVFDDSVEILMRMHGFDVTIPSEQLVIDEQKAEQKAKFQQLFADGKDVAPKFDTVRKIARAMGLSTEMLISQCEDFDLDLTDTIEQTPLVENFVKELSEYTPDERMLIQAYRMIPAEHQLEALEAILKIKAKYEK